MNTDPGAVEKRVNRIARDAFDMNQRASGNDALGGIAVCAVEMLGLLVIQTARVADAIQNISRTKPPF